MLKQEDNELITRVGPGTPMGSLMREYWVPALLSSELPTADSDPVRVLLLSEQLIAFRDTTGKVGLVQNNCPHRGASLFFGRNDNAGLRCVYHGWKFDTAGNCIDMPNEPAESDFRTKVKAVA
ncbi:MAG TPA: Rieske 2Fe-2S domain-containing protein, partial [Chloroflexota bacterium]|nr:Rieske 2Fe-2S domain-containing protein [Chloroflexota bacterium]